MLEVLCSLAAASQRTEEAKVGAIPLLSGMLESDQERSIVFWSPGLCLCCDRSYSGNVESKSVWHLGRTSAPCSVLDSLCLSNFGLSRRLLY